MDTGADVWADVWKRYHFAWEYKGRRANLDAAFNQLRQYALALENPPLLIVSDMVRFRIRTMDTDGNYLAVCQARETVANGRRLDAVGNFISITLPTGRTASAGRTSSSSTIWPMRRRAIG